MEGREWITTVIAIMGLALSLHNAWWAHRQRVARVSIYPIVSWPGGGGPATLEAIDILNDSDFSIVVADAGLINGMGVRRRLYVPMHGYTLHNALKVAPKTVETLVIAERNSPEASLIGDGRGCYIVTSMGDRFSTWFGHTGWRRLRNRLWRRTQPSKGAWD